MSSALVSSRAPPAATNQEVEVAFEYYASIGNF